MISDHIRYVLFCRISVCDGEVNVLGFVMFFPDTSSSGALDPHLFTVIGLLGKHCLKSFLTLTFWSFAGTPPTRP